MTDSSVAARPQNDFERYGLVAALTLVVLALLLADRVRSRQAAAVLPPPDRLLRVRIGGGPGAVPHAGSRRVDAPRPRGALETPAPGPAPAPRPPEAPPPRSCVVGAGETLGEIASRELGSSRRAREIADLNGLADPHRIRAGQTLKLPPR